MQHNSLAQLEIPVVMGNHLEQLPDDLFIPPNALEIFLETFSGPLDLLLYLIRKDDIDILDLDTMTWISPHVSGNIPMARNAHTMTVLGKKLYLFGGHSGNKNLKDLHVFDTETLSWTEP